VEDEPKKRTIPLWAWIMGCLGLLVACAVIFALGWAALATYAVLNSQDSAVAPEVVIVGTVAVAPQAGSPESTGPAATPGPDKSPTPEAPATVTGEPEAAAGPADQASPAPSATVEGGQETTAGLEDPYAGERATIEANVVALRQLEPKEPVKPVSVTPEELRRRVEEELLQDYDEKQARDDAIALSAFDFLPADFDLYNFLTDLLSEQIAGYYDPETDEFVIVSDDGEFGGMEQVSYAHEYVHALQDQYYNLDLLGEDTLGSEAAFAVQALAEGEATFVQTQFMLGGYFEPGQLLDLLSESLTVDTAVLDSAPTVMAHELEFPYLGGLEFVQTLYTQGGYEAVDAAWANLPQSTEQILHPQRYLTGDAPQLVSVAPLTGTLGAGWTMVEEDTLGEFYLREYLGQQLTGADVDQAATGWGGDRYAVYWRDADQGLVMALRLVWDTPADAAEFAQLYPQYPEGLFAGAAQSQIQGGHCWSGTETICLFADGAETLIVRAPDADTAGRVAAVQLAGE
jgi:hypothetical protein